MDKLLDKEIHQLYKAPSLVNYLGSKTTSSHSSAPVAGGHASSSHSNHSASKQSGVAASNTGPSTSSDTTNTQGSRLSSQGACGSSATRPKLTYPLRYNRLV